MKRVERVFWPLLVLSCGCIDVGHPAEVGCLADMSEPGCRTPGDAGGRDGGLGGYSNGARPPGRGGSAGVAGTAGNAGRAGAAGGGGEEHGGFAGADG